MPVESDINTVDEILRSTNFFYEDEISVARELVDITLKEGREIGYDFIFASIDGRTAAYTCYGPISCSRVSFDLYWIAVHRDFQKKGIGRMIQIESENKMRAAGCVNVYVETSNRPLYLPTREFYLSCGYTEAALLKDFYDIGDDKVIYSKSLA
jgi:GNAT superfamily N-acetyltransferase